MDQDEWVLMDNDRAIDGSDVVVVMLNVSHSTVECNCTMLRQQRSLSSTKQFCT